MRHAAPSGNTRLYPTPSSRVQRQERECSQERSVWEGTHRLIPLHNVQYPDARVRSCLDRALQCLMPFLCFAALSCNIPCGASTLLQCNMFCRTKLRLPCLHDSARHLGQMLLCLTLATIVGATSVCVQLSLAILCRAAPRSKRRSNCRQGCQQVAVACASHQVRVYNAVAARQRQTTCRNQQGAKTLVAATRRHGSAWSTLCV